MKFSTDFFDFVRYFEGLRLKAYLDQKRIPTIGIGCIRYPDGTPVKMGDTITQEQAKEFFLFESREKESAINDLLEVDTTQNQFDSIGELTYNIGVGGLKSSTFLRLINAEADPSTIAAELPKWNKVRVNGVLVPSDGLSRRRAASARMFLGQDWRDADARDNAKIPKPSYL